MTQPRWRVPERIETERLVLRRYVIDDAEQLAEVIPANLAHLERYMEWTTYEPQTVEQRRAWIERIGAQFDAGEDFTLGIFDREGRLIGGTGFHVRGEPTRVDIGYWIDKGHEGQGYVTEAAAALTLVALEITGADVVGIEHAPSNVRSAAVPRRLGFQESASTRTCHDSGEQIPSVLWLATREVLDCEPLASTPRPRVFGADGQPWE